jgi:hypothetical protein
MAQQQGTAAQIDYDALAQQHGGSQAAAGVDYDSLAAAHGGALSAHSDILQKYGLPAGTDLTKGYFAQDGKLKIDPTIFSKAYAEANPPPPEAKGYLANLWDEAKNIGSNLFSHPTTPMPGLPEPPPPGASIASQVPGAGVIQHGGDIIRQAKTDLPGAAGRATTDVVAAALPFLVPEAAGATSEAGGVIRSGWRKIGNPFGLASTGEELLTQGISPRTSMTGFKPALQRAAADLKTFDAESPIKSVQDLNDAIPDIKQKIWSQEIEPALQRQATKPVNMQPVADAVRGQISDEMRTFDEGNAEKLDKLADKLEATKNVAGANSLLKYINGQLESYFQKFPAVRRANLMNNPETAGWEAARAELRNQFLSTLEQSGEAGVREARLRYGAFDTLQDAVERRVNVADRAKPMSLGRIVGLAAGIPTGGLSVIAGELSNYLNKPDVLVRRGIAKLPETFPGARPTLFPANASLVPSATTLAAMAPGGQQQ